MKGIPYYAWWGNAQADELAGDGVDLPLSPGAVRLSDGGDSLCAILEIHAPMDCFIGLCGIALSHFPLEMLSPTSPSCRMLRPRNFAGAPL